jgi:hypothetical protein
MFKVLLTKPIFLINRSKKKGAKRKEVKSHKKNILSD